MKYVLFIFFLLFFTLLKAQIVNIPDANFKQKLLDANSSNDIAKDENGNNISVDVNGDGEIEVSEALLVYELSVYGSDIFPENYIQDLTGIEVFTNLKILICGVNSISTLDISSLVNLEVLNCSVNELTSLDVSNLNKLEYLICNGNNLNALDLSNLENLYYLFCHDNQLTALDCSGNPDLEWIKFEDNQITFLNLKNGTELNSGIWSDEDFVNIFSESSFGGPVNICADEFEIEQFTNYLADFFEWDLNSYCTPEPVGDYNTITGKILFDSNGDDNCDELDSPQPFIKINNSDGNTISSYFTNTLAEYVFYTMEGEFSLSPQLENPNFFAISPEFSTVNFPILDNSVEIRNFCITPNGEYSDLEIVVAPVIPAVPGNTAIYKIVYRNQGNQTVSGSIHFNFDDERIDFVTSTPFPDNQISGDLTYEFLDLLPFENREIIVETTINDTTDSPPVNVGDEIEFHAEISSSLTDENPVDNSFIFKDIVADNYEPNDLICLEGNSVSTIMIGDELHYLIRFENTGTEIIQNLVIAMELDPEKYDIPSLMVLNSSHEIQARVNGNIAEFFVANAALDTGGHGNILLKIKSNAELEAGDFVNGHVNFYFNYEYPIDFEEQTMFEDLQTEDVSGKVQIQIFPNPAENILNIQSDSKINFIEIYSVTGRLIRISKIADFKTQLNFSELPIGNYFIKIKTDRGIVVKNVVKK